MPSFFMTAEDVASLFPTCPPMLRYAGFTVLASDGDCSRIPGRMNAAAAEATLVSLRQTQRELEQMLTSTRQAIAELEARLAWSNSRGRDTEIFTREITPPSQSKP